jgi:sugar porter (SP) family MFS transporter
MNNFNKRFVYFICLVSAMGGLLFGYDWVVIGGAKPFYELYFSIADSPSMQGLAMSMALVGCLIGATLSGLMADRYGRRPLLIASAAIFFVTALATGLATTFGIFLTARFFGGIGIGIASGLSPMYIAEMAPAQVRGRLVSLNQMTIVLGILGAQIANWLIADPIPASFASVDICNSWNGQMGWRWMFWGAAFPAAAFFLLALFIPESPRWLMMKGKTEKTREILNKVGGSDYAEYEIQAMNANEMKHESMGLHQLFSSRYRKLFILGVVIAMFQQWCGTNVIFNYAQEIFQSAGYSVGDVLFNIVITGVANVIFTILALFTVDRWGRRALMLLGAGGLAGIYVTLGTCYFFHVSGFLMVVLVVMAIACYAMSLGPVTWVLLSEIFPNRVRGVAMAVCTFALWFACCALTYTFPLLNSALGSSGTFWIYAIICVAGFIYFLKVLSETKGKSLEEIEKEFTNK